MSHQNNDNYFTYIRSVFIFHTTYMKKITILADFVYNKYMLWSQAFICIYLYIYIFFFYKLTVILNRVQEFSRHYSCGHCKKNIPLYALIFPAAEQYLFIFQQQLQLVLANWKQKRGTSTVATSVSEQPKIHEGSQFNMAG